MEFDISQDFYRNSYRNKPLINKVLDLQFSDEAETEPITFAAVKKWCVIDFSDYDTLVTSMITTARQQAENFLGVSIIKRNIEALLDNSCGGIYLPYGPCNTTSDADVVLYNKNDEIIDDAIVRGLQYKFIQSPALDYIKAVYNAGFDVVPEQIKNAIAAQVAYLFEHRGEESTGELSPLAKSMLQPYQRTW